MSETVLVDFQLINYGHPAYDVLYLLFLSADIGTKSIASVYSYKYSFVWHVVIFNKNLYKNRDVNEDYHPSMTHSIIKVNNEDIDGRILIYRVAGFRHG